jgi:DNA-binding response OmpR family regulator
MSDQSRTTTPPMPDARLLVVDDELNVRSALARALSLGGYRADQAGSGLQALRLLEQTPYDLMLLDIRMPEIDGIEVMQRARQLRPEILIIVLTGHASLESAIAALKSQAHDYLLKPVSVHDVVAAVTSALQKRAQMLRRQHLLDIMDQTLEALRDSDLPEQPRPRLERFVRAGLVTLDTERRIAVIGGASPVTIELTESETSILACLMERPQEVIANREIARLALGYDVTEVEAQNIIRPHIFRLRAKLEVDPKDPQLVCTVRGRGYTFAL